MGIVYHSTGSRKSFYLNNTVSSKGSNELYGGKGYKNDKKCGSSVSHQQPPKALTRKNIQFLKSLGLKVVAGGK